MVHVVSTVVLRRLGPRGTRGETSTRSTRNSLEAESGGVRHAFVKNVETCRLPR